MEIEEQPIVQMRKSPTQERAIRTIGEILDAAAQILQKDGERGLTTNKVADRAGFSIGTLYQYFPNKDAIIVGIADRERRNIEAQIREAFSAKAFGSAPEVIREIVRILVRAFSGRRRARRFIILALLRSGHFDAVQKSGQLLIEMIVREAGRPDSGLRLLSPARAYVLTRAIQGAIRSAVLEESPLLETQEFEDELVLLAKSYLTLAE